MDWMGSNPRKLQRPLPSQIEPQLLPQQMQASKLGSKDEFLEDKSFFQNFQIPYEPMNLGKPSMVGGVKSPVLETEYCQRRKGGVGRR